MLVGLAIAVAGVMGCKKAPPTTTATGFSGPAPGPIIDTGGDPTSNLLIHRVNGTEVKTPSADPKKLDKRFLKKMSTALLVDTGCAAGTAPVRYGLANNVVVTVLFDDGSSYKVGIGDTTKEVTWTCTDKFGTDTKLEPGSDGEIPDCMLTSTRKFTSITTNTGQTGQLLIINTEK